MSQLVIVGGGPGGYAAALRAAQQGHAVTLIEKDSRVGGVCTLRGCIPTKAWLHVADVLDAARHGDEIGVATKDVALDLPKALAFQRDVVAQNVRGIESLLARGKVNVVRGTAVLEGPGKVRVNGQVLEAPRLILATGSSPRALPGAPFDGDRVISSDHALELEKLPRSIAILGAGAVGVEFASIFSRFGVAVTLLEAQDRLLPIEDAEVSAELARCLKRRGINVQTSTSVKHVEHTATGVRLALEGPGEMKSIEAEKLLVAIGRAPNTSALGLDSVGIKTERGFIPVDGKMRTSAVNLWAIGDIVPTPQLAHVAMKEAEVAVDDLSGLAVHPLKYEHVPSCTYSAPEVASAGLSEAAAKAKGYDVRVGRFPFRASGKARAINEREGFAKLVIDKKHDEVLGVHLIGPHVTELLAEATLGLRLETTAEELARAWHAHPTLSEVMGEAAELATFGHTLHL
jgi:dihydrolipoamide dehydrogenase